MKKWSFSATLWDIAVRLCAHLGATIWIGVRRIENLKFDYITKFSARSVHRPRAPSWSFFIFDALFYYYLQWRTSSPGSLEHGREHFLIPFQAFYYYLPPRRGHLKIIPMLILPNFSLSFNKPHWDLHSWVLVEVHNYAKIYKTSNPPLLSQQLLTLPKLGKINIGIIFKWPLRGGR